MKGIGIGTTLPDGRAAVGTADKGGPNVYAHELGGHLMGLPDASSGNGIMAPGPGNAVTGGDINTMINSGSVNGSRPTVTNTVIRCSADSKQEGC